MISIQIVKIGEILVGFDVKGHSDSATKGEDIICASISSACYLIANTFIEIMGIDVSVKIHDGYMQMIVPTASAPQAQELLKGFQLHVSEIAKEYPNNIEII